MLYKIENGKLNRVHYQAKQPHLCLVFMSLLAHFPSICRNLILAQLPGAGAHWPGRLCEGPLGIHLEPSQRSVLPPHHLLNGPPRPLEESALPLLTYQLWSAASDSAPLLPVKPY